MRDLTKEYIQNEIAESAVIFKRGETIYHLGNYCLQKRDIENGNFIYTIDGSYGDYEISINIENSLVKASCTCPYPRNGCKHVVAACLDIRDIYLNNEKSQLNSEQENPDIEYLTFLEIKNRAVESRIRSARSEKLTLIVGDTCKGEHLIINEKGKEYTVIIHDPVKGTGHCDCPDFQTNRLDSCKHLVSTVMQLQKRKDFKKQVEEEVFPFIHFFWDAAEQKPRYYSELFIDEELSLVISEYFNEQAHYKHDSLTHLFQLVLQLQGQKNVLFEENLLNKINNALYADEVSVLRKEFKLDWSVIQADLYPYQKEGVEFSLFKRSSIIGDEMGLGKTLQAITAAIMKKELYNFAKVLIICPASLKEQWKREIEKFSNEKAEIVTGSYTKRQLIYSQSDSYFLITNYEAVLRDKLVISRYKPDMIILDEAQRIKNFNTKTHQAIISIPHKHSLVLTGTPLENKLEDLYAIIQFTDPDFLSPLWIFAANHFLIKKDGQKKVDGYKNLKELNIKMKQLLIRRTKEEVMESLPEIITNNYYVELTGEQSEIHFGYMNMLAPLLAKKFLTPMEMQRIFQMLTCMRMVCDSTYLIDRKTAISPKLEELKKVLQEMVIENGRKTVIFSEWTTMTYCIGNLLSEMGINFIEFTGKVPVKKRGNLVDEFVTNPDCKVFLSTDAGGVGLNLQAADCVINFELPWNPAKLNQRIGRVSRIGQKSSSIQVINFITLQSIEENIMAGINLKQELFDGVFSGSVDSVTFSRERKTKLINTVRNLMEKELKNTHRPETPATELDEQLPHYLNPEVLEREESKQDIFAEEEMLAQSGSENKMADIHKPEKGQKDNDTPGGQEVEVEDILDNGMKFLNGIMQMATGKSFIGDTEQKTISINKETGEVTMKFTLPGFSKTDGK